MEQAANTSATPAAGALGTDPDSLQQMLADNLPTVVYVLPGSDVTRAIYLNDAIEGVTGYPKADFLEGRLKFNDLIHPDDLPETLRGFQQAVASRKDYEIRYRIRHKNGGWRWVRDVARGIFDNDNLTCVQGTLLDITAEEELRRQLADSEARFRQMFDAAVVGIAVVAGEELLECNPEFLRILDLDTDGARRLMAGGLAGAFPGAAACLQGENAGGSKRPRGESPFRFEADFRRPGGGVVCLDVTLGRIGFGGRVCTQLVVRDITARKRADERARESEAKFAAAFNENPIPMAIIDRNTDVLVDVNAAAAAEYGRPRDEMIGRSGMELGFYDARADRAALFDGLGRATPLRGVGAWMRNAEGRRLPVRVNAAVFDSGGREFVVSAVENLSDLYRTEFRLQQARAIMNAAVEQSPAGMTIVDAELNFIGGSTWCAVASAGSDNAEVSYPVGDPRTIPEHPLARAARHGEIVRDEEVCVCLEDGVERWYLVNAGPVYDDDGQIIAAVMTSLDITGRRQTEQKLRESEEKFAAAFRFSPFAMSISEHESGRIIERNPAGRQLIEPMRHHGGDETLAGFGFVPEYAERRAAFVGLEPGKPIIGREHTFSLSPGNERTVRYSIALFESSGRLLQLNIVEDITGQKRQARDLEMAKGLLDAAIDASPAGILIATRRDGRIEVRRGGQTQRSGHPHFADRVFDGRYGTEWWASDSEGCIYDERDMPLMRAMERGESVPPTDMLFRDKHGRRGWYLTSAAPVYGRDGEIIAGILVFLDITERKKGEDRVRDSEAKFAAAFYRHPIPMVITDRETGTILDVNEAVLGDFRLTREQIVGQQEQSIGKPVRRGLPREEFFADLSAENPIRNRELYWKINGVGNVYVRYSAAVFESGGRQQIVSVMEDITEMRLQAIELEQTRAMLEAAVNASPAGFVVADAATMKITMANDSIQAWSNWRVGRETDSHVGRPGANWETRDADGKRLQIDELPLVRAIRRGEVVRNRDYLVRSPAGAQRWCLVNAAPVRDAAGIIRAGVALFLDITDRRAAEQEVRRLNAELRVYAAELEERISVQHETEAALRHSQNRLRALNRRLQSVREEERKQIAREVHDAIGQILTALKIDASLLRTEFLTTRPELRERGDRMIRLLDDGLDSVRQIASALRPPMLDELGLKATIHWLGNEYAELTGVRCRVDLPESTPELDRESEIGICRIIQEALTNVTRHAQAKNVRISMRRGAGAWELEITDDGAGFSSAEKFGDFKSLGLTGMRERAADMGAKLHIESSPGSGTAVRIHVPTDQRA